MGTLDQPETCSSGSCPSLRGAGAGMPTYLLSPAGLPEGCTAVGGLNIEDSTDMNLSKPQEVVVNSGAWCAAILWVCQDLAHNLATK